MTNQTTRVITAGKDAASRRAIGYRRRNITCINITDQAAHIVITTYILGRMAICYIGVLIPAITITNQAATVITASNKEEGLEKIRAEKPDLAMLDVMMETWQDGFELARILKKDPDLKHIPILMLTGVRDQTGIDFKSTAGDPTWLPVDGYLEKPVEPNALLAEVERLLTEKSPDSPGT